MEEGQAKKLIGDLFSRPFDQENYQLFLRNLLNRFEPRDGHYTGNYVPDAFKQHIKQYRRIGKYVDPDDEELDLLLVEIKSFTKLDRARSALRNFAVSRLKQFEKTSSLIAFYAEDDGGADWRFSFIKIEHEAYQDGKGKIKLKQELTPAKRYSYLVGVDENCHTASKQFLPLLTMDYSDPRVGDIEAAFSIEKVTEEFFDQYKTLFQNLAEHLKRQRSFQLGTEEEIDQAISRFAKKLLGQIVFLYFLQKKGWLGVPKNGRWGEGSRRFLRERFMSATKDGGNYYRDFLQFLFYEALAEERKEQADPGFYSKFDCRVPFLNGGLFEADYQWKNEPIELPNSLFHNEERTKAGDTGSGVLDVFDRYNFTIKEDEPLEKEVAVDPEMLGKVFESMLEITERKNKGAFYTPREIVHYMCQESLVHYLDSSLNTYAAEDCGATEDLFSEKVQTQIAVPKEDIDTLIRKGHLAMENDQRVLSAGKETETYKFQLPLSIRQHAEVTDIALSTIKVCDPTIGSGAFPLGLLHEIVSARIALAPHTGNARSAYELKRHAIAESIYGVDTDASAIDIARLRLWLSLIVDEQDYDVIEALPNLDYKIVCGDSLVGFPEDWSSPAFEKIEDLKKQFFEETDRDKKAALKSEIDKEIQKRVGDSQNTFGWQVDFDFRLFFSEVWHQKGGFDVVIGNPPYVQIQKFSGQKTQADWEKQKYETFAKTGDIYCLFYEKGHRLIRDKGALIFITSNKWMRAGYGEKLRRFLLDKTKIDQLIDFGDSPIFSEATTYTNILLFEKSKSKESGRVWDLSSSYQKEASLVRMLRRSPAGSALFSEESFVITSSTMAEIKERIEKVGSALESWDITINRGILTGFNEAFIIDGKKRDELISQDPTSDDIIKPILRGRDIKRYRIDSKDLWLIATFPALDLDIDEYPAVRDYLKSFGRRLHQTGEIVGKDKNGKDIKSRKKTSNKWFETQDQISYHRDFAKEKVIYAEIVFDSAFYFDDSGIYPEATAFVLTGEHTKYLTALLNSQLLTFVFRAFYAGGDLRGDTFRYKKVFLNKIPIIKGRGRAADCLEKLVDYIQVSRLANQSLQPAYFEQIVDGLVYELYFSSEITSAGKLILTHLGELASIDGGMTTKKKLGVIQREFDRLYDPRHPVRNNLETLDSVEVVQSVRSASQRE